MLVEAEVFFEDEVKVVREGEAEQGLGEEVGEDEEEGVGNFAGKAWSRVLQEPCACQLPEFGEDVVAENREVECLAEEARDEAIPCFCPTVGLGFVVSFLTYFALEGFGTNGAAEDLVLAVGEVRVKQILADGEPDYELFPRKKRAVEIGCEVLRNC